MVYLNVASAGKGPIIFPCFDVCVHVCPCLHFAPCPFSYTLYQGSQVEGELWFYLHPVTFLVSDTCMYCSCYSTPFPTPYTVCCLPDPATADQLLHRPPPPSMLVDPSITVYPADKIRLLPAKIASYTSPGSILSNSS